MSGPRGSHDAPTESGAGQAAPARDRVDQDGLIDYVLIGILSLILAFGWGALSFMVGVFAGPVGLILLGAGLVASLWFVIRGGPGRLRIGGGIAALLIGGWALLLVPAGVDWMEHDRIMARVEAAICSNPAPAEATITRCEGSDVHNPSNGNQCGYEVTVWLDTSRSLESLREFYARPGQLPASLADLIIVEPNAVQERPDLVRMRILAIGDEGMDPRCN